MKIIQVVNALPSLQKLAKQDLSIQTLYRVSKLLNILDNEIAFYNTQRDKILSNYCDVVDNQYVPRKENIEKLNIEINELLSTEIECDVREVSVGIDEDIKLSYNDLMALEGFVRIKGEE